MSTSNIALALEKALGKPVFDETGVTNHYEVLLKWEQKTQDDPNSEALMKAVQERLGLELVPGRRPVEMLLVEQESGKINLHREQPGYP